MSLTTKIEKTERVKLRKEMLVQSKLEHCSVIGSYLKLQILDFYLVHMARKLRHRAKIFMGSERLNSAVWKSKSQQQRRSWNLSCNQTLFNIQPISRVLEVQMHRFFFFGKLRQFPRTFMGQSVQILMLAMMFCSDKKIRIVTKSRCGHLLNNKSSNQQFQIQA